MRTCARFIVIYYINNKLKFHLKPSYREAFMCFAIHIAGMLSVPDFITSVKSPLNLIGTMIIFPLLLKHTHKQYFWGKFALAILTLSEYEKPKISTIFLLPAMAFGIIMYGILLYFFGYLLHDYLNGDAITLYLLVTFFSSGEELYFDKVFGCSWLFFKANKFIARKVTKLACVYAGIVTVVFIMIRASQTIKNVI